MIQFTKQILLERHISFLTDVVHSTLPNVKKVTGIQTVCEALRAHANRNLLSEVHKLLRLYLTIPITSATPERSFSTLRRVLTYLRSTMTEKCLNNCTIHKDFTDDLDLARDFISLRDDRRKYFGTFTVS